MELESMKEDEEEEEEEDKSNWETEGVLLMVALGSEDKATASSLSGHRAYHRPNQGCHLPPLLLLLCKGREEEEKREWQRHMLRRRRR